MKAFIAIKSEKKTPEILGILKEIISASKYTPYAFVDEGYIENEKEMMRSALAKLEACDALVVEGSNTSIGIGIEAGYFLRTGKPIIALFKKGSESRTLQGIATKIVTYSSNEELRTQLLSTLK